MGMGRFNLSNSLIREIEAQGMNAVCVFSNGMPNEEMGMPSLKKVFGQFFSSKWVSCNRCAA